MGTVLLILILLGALLALIGGMTALRAWLSFRRTRIGLQRRFAEDVARLAARTGELEEGLATLDARAQQLPVRISRLQEDLATLQILSGTLATSLAQAQRILSFPGLKTFSATYIADLLADRPRTNPQSEPSGRTEDG